MRLKPKRVKALKCDTGEIRQAEEIPRKASR